MTSIRNLFQSLNVSFSKNLACITCLILAGGMPHAVGDDSSVRLVSWENRNSPEALQATARNFIGMLSMGESELQYNNLRSRPELMEVARLANEEKYSEALPAYERYYLNKLRYPAQYGISAHDVNPYTSGIAGHGAWPYPALEPKPDRAKVIAKAEQLMKHLFVIGGKEVDIGEPGKVNWKVTIL